MDIENIIEAVVDRVNKDSSKPSWVGDDFNFKINDKFFLALALSTKNAKEISVVYWLCKSMNKYNMIHNVNNKYLYERSNISKPTYYKLRKRLIDNGLIIVLDVRTVMVNPEFIQNHRKTTNTDKIEVVTMWNNYKKEQHES